MSGTLRVTAKPQSGSFNSSISLSCSGIPNRLSCSFYPATIKPRFRHRYFPLTVSATTAAAKNLSPLRKSPPLYSTSAGYCPSGSSGWVSLGRGRASVGYRPSLSALSSGWECLAPLTEEARPLEPTVVQLPTRPATPSTLIGI